jgi:hypothetical protein
VFAREGERIKLEGARLAGKWVTTPGAVRRFIEAQTPRLDGEQPPAPRSANARRRAAEQAGAELARQGI